MHSHRSNRSNSETDYRQKCKDLEARLKSQVENTKTIQQTLTDTQHELECLIQEHETICHDFELQVKQNEKTVEINNGNLQLIETIKAERDHANEELAKVQAAYNSVKVELSQTQKEIELQRELSKKLEEHLSSLKRQDSEQFEALKHKWENTITDLQDELKNAKGQVSEREQMFAKIESEYK